jgi:branched-chain amino acid transport system ATP-binding protein
VALLSINGLEAGYGGITVLRDVDIDVEPGAFVAVLGANGAGKSTLVRTILGIARRFKGSIRFDGEDIGDLDTAARIRRGVGVIPEGRQLFGDMTVQENLALGQYVHRSFGRPPPMREMEWVLDLLPRLRERLRQSAAGLSGGEAQMLAIGRALMSRPRLLLCDEPSLGLAPLRVAEMFATLDRLRQDGTAVLLADQNAKAALRLSDRAFVLESGRVVASGHGDELAADPRLRSAYLGGAGTTAE